MLPYRLTPSRCATFALRFARDVIARHEAAVTARVLRPLDDAARAAFDATGSLYYSVDAGLWWLAHPRAVGGAA